MVNEIMDQDGKLLDQFVNEDTETALMVRIQAILEKHPNLQAPLYFWLSTRKGTFLKK